MKQHKNTQQTNKTSEHKQNVVLETFILTFHYYRTHILRNNVPTSTWQFNQEHEELGTQASTHLGGGSDYKITNFRRILE